jgi:GT2 family glycosyltransferase
VFAEGRSIWSAPWTAAVFRTELFQRVGLLDEGFESYLEDVDFGLRCAALELAGRYVPDAVAWHRGSAALGRWHPETVRHIARNQLFLLARHYPAPSLFRWAWPIAVAQVLWGGVALRHGAGFSWLRGVGQGLRHYSATRRAGKPIPAGLLDHLLRANEQIIHEFQAATAFDPYWKLYFLLTRSGAK